MATNTQLYANNAKTTLAAPISSSDLSIFLTDASQFPEPASGQFFLMTIEVGSTNEIVKIINKTGNTLTVASGGRGQEGTTAGSWSVGANIGMRVTKDTLASYARYTDRLFELNSVDDLVAPIDSDGNSYICHSNDDAGNPIIAIRNNDSTWKYTTHRKPTVGAGTATAGTNTTTQLTSTAIGSFVSSVTAGKYLLQFTNGNLAGQTRVILNSSTNSVTWSVATTEAPTVGVTTFEIWQSDSSLLFTGALPLSGGTMTGDIVLVGDANAPLEPVTKQQHDAAIALKANIASPTFTGVASAPTPGMQVNTTQLVTAELLQLIDPIGIPKPYLGNIAPTGYIFAAGRTIGSAASGATERANADTQRLFEFYWNNMSNTEAPVSSGRGASATADFLANKTIQVSDMRGRAFFGKGSMGTSADAARITAAISGVNGNVMGATGGDERSQQHNHPITDPGHDHPILSDDHGVSGTGAGLANGWSGRGVRDTGDARAGVSVTGITVNDSGTGDSENLPPAYIGNWILRL